MYTCNIYCVCFISDYAGHEARNYDFGMGFGVGRGGMPCRYFLDGIGFDPKLYTTACETLVGAFLYVWRRNGIR